MFFVWYVFYYISCLVFELLFKPVHAIPIINMTNPYYERHLQHIRES